MDYTTIEEAMEEAKLRWPWIPAVLRNVIVLVRCDELSDAYLRRRII